MLWAAPNKGLSPHSTMIRREQGEVEPISPRARVQPLARGDLDSPTLRFSGPISEARIHHLQRTAGNSAVATLLQRTGPATATKPAAAGKLSPANCGPPIKGHGPGPVKLTRTERIIVESIISAAGPLGQSIVSARLAAKLLGVTVGLGVGGEAGSFAGVLAGGGLYFTPDGKIGTYGSLGGEMGVLFSASATLQFAMTKGGLENFSGAWLVFNVTGGEVLVGGVSIIADIDMNLLGIGGSIGIGAGLPFDVYGSVSNTWTSDPLVDAPD